MAEELKPCPFCGGDAVLRDGECGIRGMPMTWRNPQCTRCGCDLGYCHHLEAVERWNRRALSHAAGQDVEKPERGEATGDTTTFYDAWARLSPIDRAVITAYFERRWAAVARSEGEG